MVPCIRCGESWHVVTVLVPRPVFCRPARPDMYLSSRIRVPVAYYCAVRPIVAPCCRSWQLQCHDCHALRVSLSGMYTRDISWPHRCHACRVACTRVACTRVRFHGSLVPRLACTCVAFRPLVGGMNDRVVDMLILSLDT